MLRRYNKLLWGRGIIRGIVGYTLLCEGEERRCTRAIGYIGESLSCKVTCGSVYVVELMAL